MADVDLPEEPTFSAIPPEVVAASNPFGQQDSAMVQLHKQVNLSQLVDELAVATGRTVQVALVNPSPGNNLRDGEVRLYVTPPLPEHVLAEVVGAHEPDELYGLDEGQRERAELVAKLRRGEELSPAERDRALLLVLASG